MLKSLGEEEVVGAFGAFGGPLLDLLATSLLGVGAPVTTRATRMGRGTNYITRVLKTGKCLAWKACSTEGQCGVKRDNSYAGAIRGTAYSLATRVFTYTHAQQVGITNRHALERQDHWFDTLHRQFAENQREKTCATRYSSPQAAGSRSWACGTR